MKRSRKALLEEAMGLPVASRAVLAEELWMSVYDHERLKSLAKKAEAQADREEGKEIPLDEVMRRLRKRKG